MTEVTANTRRPGKPARLAPPTQGRGEALLLLGPAALYLVAFSIYPLVVSLVRSFMDYNTTKDTWRWIGLRNYEDLFTSSEFWTVVKNTLILTTAGVAIQVVVGTALALFFNQNLRGAAIVRGILILPMLLTPIVVGLMWRALLNPEWGLLNWVAVKMGLGYVGLAVGLRTSRSGRSCSSTPGSGRPLSSSWSTRACRRCRRRCSRRDPSTEPTGSSGSAC